MHKTKPPKNLIEKSLLDTKRPSELSLKLEGFAIQVDPHVDIQKEKLRGLAKQIKRTIDIFKRELGVPEEAFDYLKVVRIEADNDRYAVWVANGELKIGQSSVLHMSDGKTHIIPHELVHVIVFGLIPGSEQLRHDNWNKLYDHNKKEARLIRAADEALAELVGRSMASHEYNAFEEQKDACKSSVAKYNEGFEKILSETRSEGEQLQLTNTTEAMFRINRIGYMAGDAAFLATLNNTKSKQYELLRELLSVRKVLSETGTEMDMIKVLEIIFKLAEKSGMMGDGAASFFNERLHDVGLHMNVSHRQS